MSLSRVICGVMATLLAGCAVGPNYRAPAPAVPAAWSEPASGVTTNAPGPGARWWKTLGDPKLDGLIERAVISNRDLRAAEARLRAARALRGMAVADLLPTVDASASYTTAKRSANALTFPVSRLETETYQVGFDASWEMDVFGGKRRALQAATADLQAVEEDRRAVLVSLLAEVARYYMDYRGTQQRLDIARQNLVAQQQTLDLTRLRLDKGLASELEVAQAQALTASTRAQIPTLETIRQQDSHRLCVLLGQPPGALEAELSTPAGVPAPPPEVPAGLPADLLRRRPDVRRSERQLAGATARIGVAQAELFPKFFLTGSAGLQSLKADTLFSPQSDFWSAGPSVRWRLLEYPRLKAQIKAQTAQQEQALAQFEQAVLLALEEVENALVAYDRERQRRQSLREAADASARSVGLALQLYTKGLGEFLEVLVSQRALYQSQDALAQSEAAAAQKLVALYKALGGGWEPESH